MARPYEKRRDPWVDRVMAKYFRDWPDWDTQVPIYDFRGWDPKTIKSVGPLIFTRVMPRADVIALRDDELLIIEFDSQINILYVSRLEHYIDAIKNDSVRPDWTRRKISAAYVTPGYDARIEDACARKGFRYIIEPEE